MGMWMGIDVLEVNERKNYIFFLFIPKKKENCKRDPHKKCSMLNTWDRKVVASLQFVESNEEEKR